MISTISEFDTDLVELAELNLIALGKLSVEFQQSEQGKSIRKSAKNCIKKYSSKPKTTQVNCPVYSWIVEEECDGCQFIVNCAVKLRFNYEPMGDPISR